MKIELCDICERRLGMDNINIEYKSRAIKHAFDGWSSGYEHSVVICDRCIKVISKLVNHDEVTTAAYERLDTTTKAEKNANNPS